MPEATSAPHAAPPPTTPDPARAGRAAEILEEFRAAQNQVPRSALNREVGENFGFGERERIVSGAQPARFQLGNFAHDNAELLIPESELPRGLDREVKIDLGEGVTRRVDRVDWDRGCVYEIKPNTGGWPAVGQKQAETYARWLDIHAPRPNGQRWDFRVVTYDAQRLEKAFREVGDLRRWIAEGASPLLRVDPSISPETGEQVRYRVEPSAETDHSIPPESEAGDRTPPEPAKQKHRRP